MATEGIGWGDYDGDGRADLFVANDLGVNVLYHNDGGGIFSRVQNGSMTSRTQDCYGCACGDYDNDGFPDLFVTSRFREGNLLYHNNGDGTFTEITNSVVNQGGDSFGCAWGD
ncbi:MAG: VCBS repeat-containing protein, partial [Verrucomicrobia bacterium]|nr:VCBS repeat-containing protein [Verrucomicrobiota bacterium]